MPQPTKDHKDRLICYVALGSNATSSTGSLKLTLGQAMRAIESDSVRIVAKSRFYSTPAFPKGIGPGYVNAAISLVTSLSSHDLLTHLHRIEAEFDRVREIRWGARTLDLDLLDFAGDIRPDEATQQYWMGLPMDRQMQEAPDQLILPHPRIQDRAFVMIPLSDIAPDWVHPVLDKSLTELLDALPDEEKRAIQPLE